MHIIKSIAFACATLCASQAHALDNTTMNAAATVKVFVGGATALSGSIGGLFTQNCVAGTRTDYKLTSNAAFGTIYACTLIAGNDLGLPANTNVMFQKRDQGGSGIGVYPVSNNVAIDFINPTTCTGPATGTGTCTTLFQRTSDGGVSDVEPAVFAAPANTPPESVGTGVGNQFTSIPINQTIFGLAVTQNLYAALQAEQGLTASNGRPNIPQGVAGQMLASNFLYDPISWKLLLPTRTTAEQNSQLTICRRVDGSGTQTSANRFFLDYPYNSGATLTPLGALDSTVSTHGTAANQLFVIDNSTTADVRTCMGLANAAGGFALGHISLENAEPTAAANTWRFVKVGGQEPSRLEAQNGRYSYFFESTGQISNSAPASVKALLTAFFNGAGLPINLAALSAANQGGVMARPQSAACPAVFNPALAGDAAKFCSRVTRNGNSAEFPSFFR